MNRNEEYLKLIEALENTPPQLDYTMQRVEAKSKAKNLKSFFTIPVSSCVMLTIVFTLLVNCVPTFAYTCGNIPILKELAKIVAFSPSLSAAVEHRYVQPIEQEQTINGITARIEYVIVDQKQLNIFYSLDSALYDAMDATPSLTKPVKETDTKGVEQPLQGYGLSSGKPDIPNGELNYITVDFIEGSMPNRLNLILKVHDNGSTVREEPVKVDLFSDDEAYRAPDFISEFTFKLEFDPYYTAQGEAIEVNERLSLDNETIILERVEIYPTHMNLTFDDVEDNTAWLKGLDFYIENEKGKRFEKIANGISATGKRDSPMMAAHRLESSFFSKSEELTMYITEVEWLDKRMQRLKLDLKNVQADSLPQNCIFEKAEKRGNNWVLTFIGKEYQKDSSHQIWQSDYYDEEGKVYHFNSWSTRTEGEWDEEAGKPIESPGSFCVEIPLKGYPYDTVYMSPQFTRRVKLSTPIRVKIK